LNVLAGAIALVALLASCAAAKPMRPSLPPETIFNERAGRGDLLLVTLRLEGADDLLVALETGGPFVVLDRSLESKLGKPLRTSKIYSPAGEAPAQFYPAPKLYLGNTQLQMGSKVMVADLTALSNDLNRRTGSNRRLMGLLAMDSLQNYCIQLDFTAHKMRFLDPDHVETRDPGAPFPLTISMDGVFVRENLLATQNAKTQIDTGCNFDGVLTPKLFERWTNSASGGRGETHFPNGVFGGNAYSNLQLNGDGKENLIGLTFLARHLVTFNFPKRTMYLKRTSVGPVTDKRGDPE